MNIINELNQNEIAAISGGITLAGTLYYVGAGTGLVVGGVGGVVGGFILATTTLDSCIKPNGLNTGSSLLKILAITASSGVAGGISGYKIGTLINNYVESKIDNWISRDEEGSAEL